MAVLMKPKDRLNGPLRESVVSCLGLAFACRLCEQTVFLCDWWWQTAQSDMTRLSSSFTVQTAVQTSSLLQTHPLKYSSANSHHPLIIVRFYEDDRALFSKPCFMSKPKIPIITYNDMNMVCHI